MLINEENFPLYPFLLTDDNPSRAFIEKELREAQTGDDDAIFRFVMGLHPVAVHSGIEKIIPGLTTEVIEKTLQSSRRAFEELASRGHKDSKDMLDYYDANGIGLARPNSGDDTPDPKPTL